MTAAVSVVMPVWNGERFVRDALDSILRQSFSDFEFLVVDDGSTDGTPAILRDCGRSDPRVRVIRQENRGVIEALNRGCGEARGPFIARMDADDIALPGRLAAQVRHLEAHPQVAVLGSALRFLGPSGPLPRVLRLPTDPAAVRATLERDCCIAHPTVMMRRGAYMEAGGYRRAYLHAEDYDLWLRIAERHDLANLPDPLLDHRLHPGQVSLGHLEQQVASSLGARAAARLRRTGRPDPTEKCGPLTRDDLIAMGLASAAIEAAILRAFIDRGALLVDLGFDDAAGRLADDLDRLAIPAAAGNRSLARRERAAAAWIRAKVELHGRRFGHGAAWMLRACALRPALLGNVLRAVPRALGRGA